MSDSCHRTHFERGCDKLLNCRLHHSFEVSTPANRRLLFVRLVDDAMSKRPVSDVDGRINESGATLIDLTPNQNRVVCWEYDADTADIT